MLNLAIIELMKKQKREQWYLGFLGFLFLIGVRELMQADADLLDASWLLWVVWFTYFIPTKKSGTNT